MYRLSVMRKNRVGSMTLVSVSALKVANFGNGCFLYQRGAVLEWLRIGQKQRLVMNRTHRCDWYEYIFDF